MRNLKRPWTVEEDDRLRQLLEAGASFRLIAAKFKRTVGAVKSRSTAHKRAGKTPELKEGEIEMREETKAGQHN